MAKNQTSFDKLSPEHRHSLQSRGGRNSAASPKHKNQWSRTEAKAWLIKRDLLKRAREAPTEVIPPSPPTYESLPEELEDQDE